MKITSKIFLAFIVLIFAAACATSPEASEGDSMEFSEEEAASEDEMSFTEEEAAEADVEEMEFEESEGLEVSVIDAPPAGAYLLSQNIGTITCPNILENFPALPDQTVTLAVSEDLLTLTMINPEGSIELGYVESRDENDEVEEYWQGVISPAGFDLVYTIYWNFFGNEEITGSIDNETVVDGQRCETTRPFEATPINQ
jgi:hypothetical protein